MSARPRLARALATQLAGLSLLSGCAPDAPTAVAAAALPPPTPLLALDETTFPVASARPGEILRHRFHFLNASDGPVEIGAVRQSCGCTKAALSGPVLEPGEIGHVDVDLDTYQRSGALQAEVELLERSDAPRAWLAFRLVTEVTPTYLVTVEPGLIELGEIVPGAPITAEVSIRSSSSAGVEPVRVFVEPDAEVSCRTGAERVERGETRSVRELSATLELDSHDLHGRFERRVVVRIEPPDEAPRTAAVLLRGLACPPIRLDPPELYVGALACRAETRRAVAVHLRAGVSLPGLRTSQPWIVAAFERGEVGSGPLRLSLTLTPPDERGWLEEWVELESGEATQRLALRGLLRPPER